MSDARTGLSAQGRVGSVINGKWQVDARIGSGGMATVYAATHRNGHRAAIKMLHSTLSRDPSTRARFLREGYVANAVGHSGVVAVLDDGVAEDGSAFLVLELLEGETIDARRVRLGGRLPVDEALDFADQALDALSAAHAKGIVHRDIKPENLFLTNDGVIKLLDFGLARMKDAQGETTKTGVTIGTPEFMPPEQAMGRRDGVDARSDVWGLGASLFTSITGRYVHEDAQSLHEQLIASATRRSKPIRQFAPHVAPAVATVIDRSLELEKDDRWQSAMEMQEALREARGPRGADGDFASDSMTLNTTAPTESSMTNPTDPSSMPPIMSSPFSREKPASSDQTMMVSPETPRTGPSIPKPLLRPQKLEDATDMEETFVEGYKASSPRRVASAPRVLPAPLPIPSSPPTPNVPNTSRMAGRAGGTAAIVNTLPSARSAEPPPPGPNAFRGPLQTPSGDHATVTAPQKPSQRPLRSERDDEEHAATIAAPRATFDDGPLPGRIPGPRVSFDDPLLPPRTPRTMETNDRTYVDEIGPTMAVSVSPRPFPASTPPPPPVQSQSPYGPPPHVMQQQHHQMQQQHGMMGGNQMQMPPPSSMHPASMHPNPMHSGPPPMPQQQPPRSTTNPVFLVSIILIFVCLAMGAYVLARNGSSTR